MNVDELLSRLKKVRKAKDGWIACCPAHEDQNPSLSVALGQDGQILLRCFAGCPFEAILESLSLAVADLYPSPDAKPIDYVKDASAVRAVAEWLHRQRRLPSTEVTRLSACESAHGAAVVFRYRDQSGKVLYDKMRAVGAKKFWRRPKGVPSALYGLETLWESADDRIVIVEGELDAHVLRAVGMSPVVSVPDGCGSALTEELLAPLAPYREVMLATDADGPGDVLANKLARALGAERCVRVRLSRDDGGKDANDCLRAGWSIEDFDLAFARATPIKIDPGEPDANKSSSEAPDGGDAADGADVDETEEQGQLIPRARRYQAVEGQMCYVRTDRNGNEVVETLANFVASIDEEVTRDDGLEATKEFLLSGRLDTGEALPKALIAARTEFSTLNWVYGHWGARAVVFAGTGTRDHLRAAIQMLSRPTRRTIYRHTGWRKVEGAWVFLFQGGAVGRDGGIEVDLDPPLDRFAFPATAEDPREAIGWSLRLLECGPPQVMLPLLATTYLAPLASILEPDFTLWMHGLTGSLKSELATLAQRHFGDFSRKSLPCSWTSTDNAIEHRLAMLKDVLVVIDDYAPHADARAEADQARKAQRILRNVGNKAARARMRADLSGRPDRPPRGVPLCTGEMLPPGASIVARIIQIEVDRDKLDLSVITAMQASGGRLAHAMRAFMEWLAPQYEGLQTALPIAREEMRRELRSRTGHLRQPEALANLYIAFDLFLQFAESIAGVEADRAQQLRDEALMVFESLAARVTKQLGEIDPGERFVDVLTTLLMQGKVRLLDKSIDRPTRVEDAEVIGWIHGDRILLLQGAAYRRVAVFFRDIGEHWNPGVRDLYQALRKKEYVIPTDNERPDVQWRVGADGQRVRGWPLSPGVLPFVTGGVTNSSPALPGFGGDRS